MAQSLRSLQLKVAQLNKELAACQADNAVMRAAIDRNAQVNAAKSALDVQVGGDHYKNLAIQPVEYILANNLGFIEGNIVKYATRWRAKGGIKDLQKVQHFAQLLIEDTNAKLEIAQATAASAISEAPLRA